MDQPDTVMGMLGHQDNFDEPISAWNRPSTILGLTISLVILSSLCVAFRLYVRFFVVRMPGWDDLCVVLFILAGHMGSITACVSVEFGLGQHFLQIGTTQMDKWLKTFYICNGSYQLATTLVKLSLLLQYLRMYEAGRMRLVTQVMFGVVLVWGLTFTILAWFPCSPVSDYWRFSEPQNCWGFGSDRLEQFVATFTTQAGSNVFFDVVVLCIPLPKYLRGDIDRKTRAGLAGLFLLGGLVISVSIWRFSDMVSHRATTWPTFDPTWYGCSALCLGMVEVNLAIICASVPVFWPTLSKALLGEIFVTQEVMVTRHMRYSTDVEREDEIELRRAKVGKPGEHKHHRSSSSQQSIICRVRSEEKSGHYLDDYVMAQVSPIESSRSAFAHSSDARSEGESGRREA